MRTFRLLLARHECSFHRRGRLLLFYLPDNCCNISERNVVVLLFFLLFFHPPRLNHGLRIELSRRGTLGGVDLFSGPVEGRVPRAHASLSVAVL